MQYKNLLISLLVLCVVVCYHLFGLAIVEQYWPSELIYDIRRYSRYLVGTTVIRYATSLTTRSRESHIQKVLYASHIVIIAYFFIVYARGLPGFIAGSILVFFALLLWGITLNTRWRTLFILPSSIALCILVIIVSLPKYDTIPSVEQFYDMFGTKLHIVVKDVPLTLREISAEIIITTDDRSSSIRIPIQETSANYTMYAIMKPTQIHFESSQPLYNTFGFLQLYDGQVLPIPAQSIRTTSYTQSGYTSDLTGIAIQETIESSANFIAYESSLLQSGYMDAYKNFLIQSVGGERTQYIYVDRAVGYTLSQLAHWLPDSYKQNHTNYLHFKTLVTDGANTDERIFSPETSIPIWQIIQSSLKQTRLFKNIGN